MLNHKFLKGEGGLLVAEGADMVTIWFPDIAVDMKDEASKLGEGAGGKVFLGTFAGQRVAVKKVAKRMESSARSMPRRLRLLKR